MYRRKCLLVFLFAFILASSSKAQEQDTIKTAQDSIKIDRKQKDLSFCRSEFNIYGTVGFSDLHNKLREGSQRMKIGFNAGIGYSYFFHRNWGVGVGLEFDYYQSRVRIGEVRQEVLSVDAQQDTFMYKLKVTNYEENSKTYLFSIPLFLQFQTAGKVAFYANAGAKLGIPITSSYISDPENLSLRGYYSKWNVEFEEDLPQHGFMNNSEYKDKGTTKLKLTCSLIAEIGMKFRLSHKLSLYTGLYVDYGLTNMKKSEEKPLFEYSYYGDIKANSVSSTSYSSRVSVANYGFRARLGIGTCKKESTPEPLPEDIYFVNLDSINVLVADTLLALNDSLSLIQEEAFLLLDTTLMNELPLDKKDAILTELDDKIVRIEDQLQSVRQTPYISAENVKKADEYQDQLTDIRLQIIDIELNDAEEVALQSDVPEPEKIKLETKVARVESKLERIEAIPNISSEKSATVIRYKREINDVRLQIIENDLSDLEKTMAQQPEKIMPKQSDAATLEVQKLQDQITKIEKNIAVISQKPNLTPENMERINTYKNELTGLKNQIKEVLTYDQLLTASDWLNNSLTIYFDFAKYDVKAMYRPSLDTLALYLNQNKGLSLDIFAYTDSRGSEQYNMILSEQRAKSVVKYLAGKGIEESRLNWKGFGETNLAVPNAKTEKEHALNRRATITPLYQAKWNRSRAGKVDVIDGTNESISNRLKRGEICVQIGFYEKRNTLPQYQQNYVEKITNRKLQRYIAPEGTYFFFAVGSEEEAIEVSAKLKNYEVRNFIKM